MPGGGSPGILRTDRLWDAFWDAFWMNFGGPDPPKLSSRASETLIFEKSAFSLWYRFLLNFGFQKLPKMKPKSIRKSIKKSMQFCIEIRTTFYRKRERRWSPKGSQNVNFGGPLGCLFHDLSQVPGAKLRYNRLEK